MAARSRPACSANAATPGWWRCLDPFRSLAIAAVALSLIVACGPERSDWADLAMPAPPGFDGAPEGAVAQDVACAPDGFCIVTGVRVPGGLAYASAWTGSGWLPQRVPGTRASCVSARFCAMVTGTELLIWNGMVWHTTTQDSVWGLPGSTPADVSCPQDGWCLAVGSGRTATWDGRSWQDRGGGPPLAWRLSCVDPRFCLAAPEWSGPDHAPLYRWDGATWRTIDVALPGRDWRLTDLSCWAPDRCLLAGYHLAREAPRVHVPALRRWDGVSLEPAAGAPAGDIQALSCAASPGGPRCLALGPVPSVLMGDGDHWRELPPPTPTGGSPRDASVAGVSCTADWCVAVGQSGRDGVVTPAAFRTVLLGSGH
jgi:hypothetical protein